MRPDRQEKTYLAILILLSFFLFFFGLDSRDIWNSSELRYAQAAKEMYEDGSWLVPHLGGEPYYNKPPLYFWTIALLDKLMGEASELAARLPAALGALGTVILTYFLGRQILGSTGGFIAAIMLASSPKFQHFAMLVRMDSLHTFFSTSALAAFYFGYTRKKKRYQAVAGIAIALAALTKGPLSVVFPFGIIFWYVVLQRDSAYLYSRGFIVLLLTFLSTISLWAVPAFLSGGESYLEGFTRKNVIFHVATRTKKISSSYGYLLDIFVGAAPWAFFLPMVLYNRLKDWRAGLDDRAQSFLIVWLMVIFFGFFLSFERRTPYLLPLYPAITILVSSFITPRIEASRNDWKAPLHLYCMGIVVGIAAGAVANNPEADVFNVFFALAAVVVVVFLVLLVSSVLRAGNYRAFFISSLITLISCEISQAAYFLPKVNDLVSTKAVCREVARVFKKGDTLVIYKIAPLHYTFYTNAYPQWVGTKQALIGFLNSHRRAYCLMLEEHYIPLQEELRGFPARRIKTKENTYMLIHSNRRGFSHKTRAAGRSAPKNP